MNTETKKTLKMTSKNFFQQMNNSVFSKTIENVIKRSDIKLITTKARRSYIVSELNHHATRFFAKNILAIEMRKTQIFFNKPVYLGLSIRFHCLHKNT